VRVAVSGAHTLAGYCAIQVLTASGEYDRAFETANSLANDQLPDEARLWALEIAAVAAWKAGHNREADEWFNEALAFSVRKDGSPPVLRLYSWSVTSVTLGYFQKYHEEVDQPFCKENKLDVVRRLTGGRAIVHGPEEITYSFSASFTPHFAGKDLHQTYRQLSEAFVRSLNRLGISATISSAKKPGQRPGHNPVCFQSLSFAEAAVEGRKIIGSAQKRWSQGFLQQGSIPLEFDHETLFSALRFRSSQARERLRQTASGKMAGLREFIPELKSNDLVQAIREGFEDEFAIRFVSSSLTRNEERQALDLITKRYGNDEWNRKR